MSAIAGLFTEDQRGTLGHELDTLFRAMRHRGADRRDEVVLPSTALGVQRHDWETPPHLAGAPQVARRDDVLVVSDASIYYHADLRRSLGERGHSCSSAEPAELILAAYLAYGVQCVHALEGDFAFIVHDGRDGRVLLVRDHVGRRPLHYAATPRALVAASTCRAVAGHPTVNAPLNLPAIAGAVGGLLGGSLETGFVGVHPVPAGAVVEWRPGQAVGLAALWTPPEFRVGGRSRLEESARELQRLLLASVQERAAPDTAVWLSGGADSTAVFGILEKARSGSPPEARGIHPVTVSYPVGDSAREDDFVEAVAARWGAEITWIDSEAVPLLADAVLRAGVRDDPYAHTFEHINRRLAGTSHSLGARVAFDGYGGDQLFHVSYIYLADLFVRVRWRELRRAAQAVGAWSPRGLAGHCLVPWLPERLYRMIQQARGRDPADLLEARLPAWLAGRWRDADSVRDRTELEPPRRFFESPAAYESRWYTRTPFFPRSVSWAATIALEAGVDVRSPLMDRRVLEFAASRPLSERVAPGETKVLLRQAVQGLIPTAVLAPRATKTGVPRGTLHRRVRQELPAMAGTLFGGDQCRLADLGIIEPGTYRSALAGYLETGDHITGVQLLLTLQCELWLRSVLGA